MSNYSGVGYEQVIAKLMLLGEGWKYSHAYNYFYKRQSAWNNDIYLDGDTMERLDIPEVYSRQRQKET